MVSIKVISHRLINSKEMVSVFLYIISGIMIDDNYSFILSEWRKNQIEGPFMIVYPDQSILYGYINDKKIGQFVCYEVNSEFNMILSKNTNIIIVDLLSSHSILALKISQSFLDEHTLTNILQSLQKEEKNKQIQKGFQLISQDHYKDMDEKYKIYQQKLSLSNIPQHLRDYHSFISKHFQSSKDNNKMQLIQIVRTKQEMNISFKKCSLTLFLKLSTQGNHTKMIGSMNKYQNDFEFYKKVHHSANIIQEVAKDKQTNSFQYTLRPRNRPKQCKIALSYLHKKSVTHTDQFININYIYQIKQNLEKINELINLFVTHKVAQIQMENTLYLNQQNIQDKSNKSVMNYTLLEVQQEIYDAVKRKRQNSGKKVYLGNNNGYSRVTQKPIYHNKSTDNLQKSVNRPSENYTKNNSPYIMKKSYVQDPILESRLNRSKTNLSISQANIKVSPAKNVNNARKQPQTSGKKYSYLDEVQDNLIPMTNKKTKSPVKYEGYGNMRRLTEDFENIKRQIELNTPRKKKTGLNYFRLDNQVYRNSSKINVENDYSVRQRADDKYSPLSQKKVFKYLPN